MPFIAFIKKLFKIEETNLNSTLESPPDVIIINPTILDKTTNTDDCFCDNPKCKCGKTPKARKPRKPRTKKSAVK